MRFLPGGADLRSKTEATLGFAWTIRLMGIISHTESCGTRDMTREQAPTGQHEESETEERSKAMGLLLRTEGGRRSKGRGL
jgi:hypothetical protein